MTEKGDSVRDFFLIYSVYYLKNYLHLFPTGWSVDNE